MQRGTANKIYKRGVGIVFNGCIHREVNYEDHQHWNSCRRELTRNVRAQSNRRGWRAAADGSWLHVAVSRLEILNLCSVLAQLLGNDEIVLVLRVNNVTLMLSLLKLNCIDYIYILKSIRVTINKKERIIG